MVLVEVGEQLPRAQEVLLLHHGLRLLDRVLPRDLALDAAEAEHPPDHLLPEARALHQVADLRPVLAHDGEGFRALLGVETALDVLERAVLRRDPLDAAQLAAELPDSRLLQGPRPLEERQEQGRLLRLGEVSRHLEHDIGEDLRRGDGAEDRTEVFHVRGEGSAAIGGPNKRAHLLHENAVVRLDCPARHQLRQRRGDVHTERRRHGPDEPPLAGRKYGLHRQQLRGRCGVGVCRRRRRRHPLHRLELLQRRRAAAEELGMELVDVREQLPGAGEVLVLHDAVGLIDDVLPCQFHLHATEPEHAPHSVAA
mmetsp:Transcript_20442/g.59251  ORF Transcript_20442/g.59251 Transcript_20442/m.59251 type:complete len:311 (-) Transcript_20442:961-1893(-)